MIILKRSITRNYVFIHQMFYLFQKLKQIKSKYYKNGHIFSQLFINFCQQITNPKIQDRIFPIINFFPSFYLYYRVIYLLQLNYGLSVLITNKEFIASWQLSTDDLNIQLMWSQFLNESRSQRKIQNRPVIILGSKHSGKRSLIESLFDISKTNIVNKRLSNLAQGNKIRLKGITTAIDYAYLNVIDTTDTDNRTHAKLEVFMIEEIDNPSIYAHLATPEILKKAFFIIMLDFTNPWNFIQEIEKWMKFLYELQQMAKLSIADLQEMAKNLENSFKKFKQPQFDENGKLRIHLVYDRQQEEQLLSLPLPQGVLSQNIRVPLLICINKCDLQSQVLREQSTTKILIILYHLRLLCTKYGAGLIYTSIRNNSNLNVLYEYIISRLYSYPLRFKPQPMNEEVIFIPFGYDNPNLIKDSVVKLDISREYNDVIPYPSLKKHGKQEILVEEDSKFFEKYINQNQANNNAPVVSEREERAQDKKPAQVTDFFKNLLQNGPPRRDTIGRTNIQQTQRAQNAQRQLMRHTNQVLQRRKDQQ